MIDGVTIEQLKTIKDHRGQVMHMVKNSSPLFEKFGEIYFSWVNAGIIKGWKKHLQMSQIFAVPSGNLKIVIFDDRPNSPNVGQFQEILLGEDNYCLLKIAPQLWYSWSPIGGKPAMLANLTDLPHDPTESVGAEIGDQKFPYRWADAPAAPINKPLKVSVIMNCYNSDEFLKEAIDSVYGQTLNDWEIVFWDNASTDKSAEIAKGYDARLRYFRSLATLPLGEARNKALAEASGEYVAFLDCDDLWSPEKLALQVDFLDNNLGYNLIYNNTIKFNHDYEAVDFAENDAPPVGDIFNELLRRNFITLSSALCRRSALIAMETVFDQRFQLSEDWDLWLRLCYSAPAGYVHKPLTKWRVNPKSLTHKKFILYAEETELIIEKLKQTHSQIETDYPEAVRNLRDRAIYYRGLGLWFDNRSIESRKILRPWIFKKKKVFLSYIATFLPRNFICALERIYFRLRLSRFL